MHEEDSPKDSLNCEVAEVGSWLYLKGDLMQMKFKGGSVKAWLLRVTCGGWSDLLTKQRPARGSLASGAASKDHVTATCWRSRPPSHAYSPTPFPPLPSYPPTHLSLFPSLHFLQTNQQFCLLLSLLLQSFTSYWSNCNIRCFIRHELLYWCLFQLLPEWCLSWSSLLSRDVAVAGVLGWYYNSSSLCYSF